MGYRLSIAREAQREYRDIVSYLVNVVKSPQAARHFMTEFDARWKAFGTIPKHSAYAICLSLLQGDTGPPP